MQCFDVATGKKLWSIDAGTDRGGKHRKGSGANPSAVTDGKQVFGYFRSGHVVAADVNGKVLWTKNLQEEFGEDTLWWDLGTSPLLTDGALVIAVMQTGPSYLVALNKQTAMCCGEPIECSMRPKKPRKAIRHRSWQTSMVKKSLPSWGRII